DAVSALGEPAGQHRRNGLVVACPHSHHRRAAKAQDADRLFIGSLLAWRRPQPAFVERYVGTAVRALPPFDIGLPVDADGAAELVEIPRRPVSAAIGVGPRSAVRAGRAAIS